MVSVMIAGTMMLIMTYAFFELQNNMGSSYKGVERSEQIMVLNRNIIGLLSDPENCKLNLENLNPQNTNQGVLTRLRYKNQSGDVVDLYQDSSAHADAIYGGVRITGFTLSDAADWVDVTDKNTTHFVTSFYKGAKAKVPNLSKSVQLFVKTQSGVITECQAIFPSNAEGGSGVNLKIGNDGSACDNGREGQLRYDSTFKQMQFCDGTSWKVLKTE